MTNKRKLTFYIIMTVMLLASLLYGIFVGDPQDMRIEASGL